MCTNILFRTRNFIADYQCATKCQFLVDKLLTSCERRNSRFFGFLTLCDWQDEYIVTVAVIAGYIFMLCEKSVYVMRINNGSF